MVDEMISRNAAIDAMKDMYRAAEKWLHDATDDVTKERAESCMASLVEIKLRTEKLPAVQPEIIRCKDCKYMIDTGDDLMCDNAKGWVVATASDFGCVLAERRTE